jgi:hypothetical protein
VLLGAPAGERVASQSGQPVVVLVVAISIFIIITTTTTKEHAGRAAGAHMSALAMREGVRVMVLRHA